MRKPDTILNEIHTIRRAIEEKTKGMTHSEIDAYYRNSGKAAAAKYGFKIYRSAEDAECELNVMS